MFFKRIQTPKNKIKQTRIKLTHNQKQNIDAVIKIEKIKKVYAKYGYELPK